MNKRKNKTFITYALYTVLVVLSLWISITGTIQRFKCTSMTETELFLHIPKSMMCNWQNCN